MPKPSETTDTGGDAQLRVLALQVLVDVLVRRAKVVDVGRPLRCSKWHKCRRAVSVHSSGTHRQGTRGKGTHPGSFTCCPTPKEETCSKQGAGRGVSASRGGQTPPNDTRTRVTRTHVHAREPEDSVGFHAAVHVAGAHHGGAQQRRVGGRGHDRLDARPSSPETAGGSSARAHMWPTRPCADVHCARRRALST